MDIKLETFLNRDLSAGSTRVDAVFSVGASGAPIPVPSASGAPVSRVVGLLCDRSASMAGQRIDALRQALAAAVNMLDEDTEFFIVSFADDARLEVPLKPATSHHHAIAMQRIARLAPKGGTVMSRALAKAREVFATRPDAIRQAILLTDGENSHFDRSQLEIELGRCVGVFQVHCRGVGTDWSPAQLRRIAEELLGSVRMVADPDGLEADFQDTLATALSQSVADLRLRLWVPRDIKLHELRQGYPVEVDLTDRVRVVGQQTIEVSLGAWGNSPQDYAVSFDVTPCAAGQRMLVCRPSLVFPGPEGGETVIAGTPVTVAWAAEAVAPTNDQVAHYAAQAEKARVIQEGLAAIAKADDEVATQRLGRAVQLAAASGDAETTRRLRAVVDVVDEAAGTVRIRRDSGRAALMDLDVASTRTVRAKRT